MSRFPFFALFLIACSGTEDGQNAETGCEDCPSTTDDTGDPPESKGYFEAFYTFEGMQLACKVNDGTTPIGETIVGEEPVEECLADLGIPVDPGSYNLRFGAGSQTLDGFPTHTITDGEWAGYTVVSPEVEVDIAADECKLVEATANAYPVGTMISCLASDQDEPRVEELNYTDGKILSLPGIEDVNVDGIGVSYDNGDGFTVDGLFTGPRTIEGSLFYGPTEVTFVCTVE